MSELVLSLEPVAVRHDEAAAALAMSPDHFDRHVRGDLRTIKVGQRVLYPVSELKRWADENADHGGLRRRLRDVA
jgi:hypothetical protein